MMAECNGNPVLNTCTIRSYIPKRKIARIFTLPEYNNISQKSQFPLQTECFMPFARHNNQSPAIQICGYLASGRGILIAIAVIIPVIFALDIITPLDEPVWLLYFIPLALSYWSGKYYAIPTVFMVTVFLLVAGFSLSPEGIPVQLAILRRFIIFLGIFIAISFVLWIKQGRQIREETLLLS
jgi:hypothetical protein